MFFSPRVESHPKTGPHTPPPPQARAAPAPHPPLRGGRCRRGRAHSLQPEGWPFSAPPPLSLWTRWVGWGRTEAKDQSQKRRGLPEAASQGAEEAGSGGGCRPRGPQPRSGPARGGPAPPPARLRRSLPQHLALRGAPSRLQRGLCRAGLALGQAPKQSIPPGAGKGFSLATSALGVCWQISSSSGRKGRGPGGGGRAPRRDLTFHPELLHVGLQISCL